MESLRRTGYLVWAMEKQLDILHLLLIILAGEHRLPPEIWKEFMEARTRMVHLLDETRKRLYSP